MLNAWRLTLTGLALILGLFVRFSGHRRGASFLNERRRRE